MKTLDLDWRSGNDDNLDTWVARCGGTAHVKDRLERVITQVAHRDQSANANRTSSTVPDGKSRTVSMVQMEASSIFAGIGWAATRISSRMGTQGPFMNPTYAR